VGRVLEHVVVRVREAHLDLLDLARIETSASQKRSSSSFDSLSVGSIMSVPGTGQDTVGAWKP
jgi:hypothetical protein